MLQIENEYGSVLCDHVYTIWLRDLIREQLGNDVVLYTSEKTNFFKIKKKFSKSHKFSKNF